MLFIHIIPKKGSYVRSLAILGEAALMYATLVRISLAKV